MFEREMEVALEAGEAASAYLRTEFATFQAIANAPADISTHADKQSQEIIFEIVRRNFPADAFVAEEASASLAGVASSGPRVWVVDPIDGTRGFATKNGEFSVMIGFIAEGEVVVGVVDQPAVGRRTFARKGAGCFQRDHEGTDARCKVTSVRSLAESTLTQSRSRNPAKRSPWVDAFAPAKIVETYSAGIKLALVARGEADVYVNSYEAFRDWDICAGHLLVTEAGGQVTGVRGEAIVYGGEGAFQRNGLLASNGLLHESALKAGRVLRGDV